jgi:hypothetical protein
MNTALFVPMAQCAGFATGPFGCVTLGDQAAVDPQPKQLLCPAWSGRSGGPIEGEARRAIRIAGVAEDVTERRQLESPVVAVTSYPEQFEKKDALAAGCEAYLVKPIDTRKLPRLISNVRKNHSLKEV